MLLAVSFVLYQKLFATVAVFEAMDVCLVEVAEGYFEEYSPARAAGDAVLRTAWAEEMVALMSFVVSAAYVNRARALEHAPEFVAMLVGLQADRLAFVDSDYLHGRLLIEREALEVAPRANFFFIVCESFHTLKYSASLRLKR